MSSSSNIAFKAWDKSYLPLLHEWLHNPHVREFWDDGDRTLEQVENHYKPQIGIKRYIVEIEGIPTGYFQSYSVNQNDDYDQYNVPGKITLGIDYFIGDPHYLNQGYGSGLLSLFIERHCLEADRILVDPDPTNKTAIHIYQKYGFQSLGEHVEAKANNDQLSESKRHIIMCINLRRTARAVVLNPENRILLMHISVWPDLQKNQSSQSFWCTLGGRIEKEESIEDALDRELFEEAGFIHYKKKELGYGEQVLVLNDFSTRLIEKFYVVHVDTSTVHTINHTEEEKMVVQKLHWWSIEELVNTQETVFPQCLHRIIMDYLKNPDGWKIKIMNLN